MLLPVLVMVHKVVVACSKESIANVSQSRQDDSAVRQVVVDHSYRDGDIRVFLRQEFQSGTAGHDGDNMDFGNAPLRKKKRKHKN